MEERDTQKPRGFVVWKLSDVGAVRRRVSDSRDTSESSSRPGDAIATRPRRIRARSAVSGARACPAKCVPSPPRVVSSHPRKRVQKKARKEVSHRVSRVRRPESLTGLDMRIRHDKKRISPTHLHRGAWTFFQGAGPALSTPNSADRPCKSRVW